MNTRIIMGASAIFMGLLGIAFTFLPQEILDFFNESGSYIVQLCLQILGVLYLGFAICNWMSKASLIGGIYNRPLALANALHFFVGAITQMKVLGKLSMDPVLLTTTFIYTVFALLFIKIIFTTPKKVSQHNS